MKIKKGISQEQQLEVIDWAFEYFKYVIKKNYFSSILEGETNWDISVLLIDENDKIMGVYLLGDKQLDSITTNEKYIKLNGVEGVLLAVSDKIRGQGWGNKLKDYPKTLGFDYVWGQQLKILNNLDDWLKRRELIEETQNVYITAEIF